MCSINLDKTIKRMEQTQTISAKFKVSRKRSQTRVHLHKCASLMHLIISIIISASAQFIYFLFQFSSIINFMMAICYREQGNDQLQTFEDEVR
jgi:hypothetical protein